MLLTLSLQAYTTPFQDPTSHQESLPSYQALPSRPCFSGLARLSTSSLCAGPLTNGFMSGNPVFPPVPDAHQALSGLWEALPPNRLYVWLRQLHLHVTAAPSPHPAHTAYVGPWAPLLYCTPLLYAHCSAPHSGNDSPTPPWPLPSVV